MLEQDGTKWYRPTEYADMYGKSPQCVNGLINRGSIASRTIRGKTYVSGSPPFGWEKVYPQEALSNKLDRMHPFDFQDRYWEGGEEPPPKDEPFRGAWKLAKKYDLSWRYVAWAGAKLKNNPFKTALYFQIIAAKDKAFSAAEIQCRPQNPHENVFEYYFNGELFEILNNMEPREK